MTNMIKKLLLNNASDKFSLVSLIFEVFLLATLTVVLFSPGIYSYDSVVQLKQALGSIPYDSWHPPIMTKLWAELISFSKRIDSLFILHITIYWFSCAIITNFVFSSLLAKKTALVVLGLWPPLFLTTLHVWKDVGMMVSLYGFCSFIVIYLRTKRPVLLCISGIFLLYATLVRVNSILFTWPLLLLWSYLWVNSSNTYKKYKKILFICITALFICFTFLLNTAVHKNVQNANSLGSVLYWDLSAISINTNQDLLPLYVQTYRSGNRLSIIKEKFFSDSCAPLFEGISVEVPEDQSINLVSTWLSTIRTYPLEYLEHRYHVFSTMLGLNGYVYYPLQVPLIHPNPYVAHFTYVNDDTVEKLTHYILNVTQSKSYKNIYYAIILVFSCVFSFYKTIKEGLSPCNAFIVAVCVSGLSNLITLFFVAPAADHRYCIWTVLASILSLCLIKLSFLEHSQG